MSLLLFYSSAQAGVEVKAITTENKINAWLIEQPLVPMIAIEIGFKHAGFAHDPKDKQGLALIVSRLLLEGTEDHDALEFNQELENRAIRLNFSVDEDFFYVTLQTLTEHVEEAFELLDDVLEEPRFAEESINKAKEQLHTDQARLYQLPHVIANQVVRQKLFPDHPYSQSQWGTAKTIENISVEDIRNYARTHFTKEHMVIGVAGDIDEEALAELLEEHFDDLEDSSDIKPIAMIEPLVERKEVVVKQPNSQTMVQFVTKGLAHDESLFFPAFVMNQIIGGSSLTSRLGEAIREEKGLVYYVNSYLIPMQASALWLGSFSSQNTTVVEAIQTLRATLQKAKEGGFTDEEVNAAKRYLTGSFLLQLTNNKRLANYLLFMQLRGLDIDYITKRNDYINAVTTEEVNEAAKMLLSPEKLVMILVGDPELTPVNVIRP
jgi:zinc protease